ncbi:MAG TPA: hypothetical protein VMR25_11740, partial [Planctomycetaceae bacterium]|nr:hypothetical protein [Planctomycetaceae bacterium]
MATNWPQRQKERKIRLELSTHDNRCWKKFRDGKHHYFMHPLTKEGYEAALREWTLLSAKLDGERPNAPQYHHQRDLFTLVQSWYDRFGVPKDEAKLAQQVEQFLDWIAKELEQPTLPYTMPVMAFVSTHSDFLDEFGHAGLGTTAYRLPEKWQERIRQLDDAPAVSKCQQTIEYWVGEYLTRTKKRAKGTTTTIGTARDRVQRLNKYKRMTDTSKHVTTIDPDAVDKYHDDLNELQIAKKTKEGYFNAFRMMVRWISGRKNCDLYNKKPANLENKDWAFREPDGTGRKRMAKKEQLWTPEEFATVLKTVPQPYRAYLVTSLNCGFRSSDLSALRKTDLRLADGRIVIQRQKMNQQETAPVVSYRLWDITVKLINEALCDDPVFAFAGRWGNRLVVSKFDANGEPKTHDNLATYWGHNREEYGLAGKRLDYIRKTGSTWIKKIQRGIEKL